MAEQGLRRTGGTELNLESMGVNLPYNMQAEQSVLGAALLQADIIPELVELLRPEMFYACLRQARPWTLLLCWMR